MKMYCMHDSIFAMIHAKNMDPLKSNARVGLGLYNIYILLKCHNVSYDPMRTNRGLSTFTLPLNPPE